MPSAIRVEEIELTLTIVDGDSVVRGSEFNFTGRIDLIIFETPNGNPVTADWEIVRRTGGGYDGRPGTEMPCTVEVDKLCAGQRNRVKITGATMKNGTLSVTLLGEFGV